VKLGPTGRALVDHYEIEPEKKYLRPYWLESDPLSVVLTAAGTPGDEADLEFMVDQQGHFDWNSILGSGTEPYTLDFFDIGTQRRLQNRPVHSGNIVGSGVRPFYLAEPYFINVGNSQRAIRCRVRNLAAISNTVRVLLYGRRYYHNEAPPEVTAKFMAQFGNAERVYSYFVVPEETMHTGDIAPILAGQSETYRLTSDSEADTVLVKSMVYTDPPSSDFDFTLRERTTNRLIMTNRVRGFHGWGNSEFPFRFADSYLLERQKDLFLTVNNLSGVDAKFFFTLAALRIHFDPFTA
jgi:hypothetical protein